MVAEIVRLIEVAERVLDTEASHDRAVGDHSPQSGTEISAQNESGPKVAQNEKPRSRGFSNSLI